MRTAALVLLPSKDLGPYLEELKKDLDGAKTTVDRERLALPLAYGYLATDRWQEVLPVAEELVKAEPRSLRAFYLLVSAYKHFQRFNDWDTLVRVNTQRDPDELAYVRSAADLEAYRGQVEKSREITKGIIDKGKANEQDLNLYAWYALSLPAPIDSETLEIASRANDLTKNSNFAILHTVACAYAQAGKTTQAREYLLKAMDVSHLDEPNPAVWLGFALIAEQYGTRDAAETMYRRVAKSKVEVPGSLYAIAQQHLARLSDTNASAKVK